MFLMYLARQKAYTAFMHAVNHLWYYSSAHPDSGYRAAVEGYACKLAHLLGFTAIALEHDDANALRMKAREEGMPQVVIGAGEGVIWPAAPKPLLLKPRPYADMHGRGASMHALTPELLTKARAHAHRLWPNPPQRILLVCVANPHWLITEGEAWAYRLKGWMMRSKTRALLMANSPRTNPLMWQAWQELFMEALPKGMPKIITEFQSPYNRYREMLSICGAVLILGSSRSMAGEAALSGAPVYYCGDDETSTDGFFADTEAMLGNTSPFRRLDVQADIVWQPLEPVDVTLHHVQQTLLSHGLVAKRH